jgi:hypothetical protein
MVGSAIYFMSTGMSHSHTRKLLSSDVVTNRLLSSTNVIELTAPKCLSYSWTMSPDLVSHYKNTISVFLNFETILTYTNNFFVRGAGYKQMLLVLVWIKFNTVRDFPTRKSLYNLTSFRVPQLDVSVVCYKRNCFNK